jgi:hypothetical protein
MSDDNLHLRKAERLAREVVLRKGDWTMEPELLAVLMAEYDRRGAHLDDRPTGDAACTACGGVGTVWDDGYYVPGEQFVEPPFEARCEACIGSGGRDVQRLISQRAAVLAIHHREDSYVCGGSCAYCRDSDEDPVKWPCSTAEALGVTS